MLRRVRTTKNLAKRIDMQYFARPHPLRRWRFLLSVALPVIGVVWLLSHWVVSQEPFASGPVSASHAAFVNRCAVCHTGGGGFYFKAVTEKACLGCHDAPPHYPKTVLFTPTCGSCHQEHRSRARLIEVRDQACAECHADLKLRSGAATFQNASRFGGTNHPEFYAKRSGFTDPSKIKFNHQVHLALGGCDSCHTAAGLTEVAGKADNGSPVVIAKLRPGTPLNDVSGAYMLPIKFADHCATCHADKLEFDKTILESVPHTTPKAIHAEIMKHAAGKEAQVAALEVALWEKCSFCHVLKVTENELPEVVPPGLKTRWFQHAKFSHDVHSVFTCQSCHAAASSTTASDVLLPGIAKCESCHHPKGARSGCFECHSYHDWSTRKPVQAPLDVACAGQGSTAAACQGSGTESGTETVAAAR